MNAETTTSPEQDAVRMLILLAFAGQEPARDAPADSVREMRAESRLHALDFWLRNPDYLAYELLTQYRESQRSDLALVRTAHSVMEDDELELRTIPMLRFLFGAYEELDESFSLLTAYDLAYVVRRPPAEQRRRDFYLTSAGALFVERLPTRAAVLGWYVERARLVASVAGDRGGDELKQRQKQQTKYRLTRWGNRIGTIAELVRDEIAQELG